MKKKILSLVLVVAFALSLGSAAFAATFERTNDYADARFSDVSTADWFFESVKTAYEFGLVKGSSATSFTPKGNITVAETIVLAARLHNIYNGGKGEFIQGSPWYKVYVDYALENGIITNAYRDYGVKISRANFAFILANALPSDALTAINKIENGELTDVKDDYKSSAIYTLYRAGVLTGNDEFGTFNPDSTITRAEVSAIITRMADKTQRKRFLLKKKTSISAEIYRGALRHVDESIAMSNGIYLSDYLDSEIQTGITGADLLKEQTMAMLKEYESVYLFALDNGIKISEDDKKDIEEASRQLVSLGATDVEFYKYYAMIQLYYNSVSELFAKGGKYAVNTDVISDILPKNYVRVKHILVQASAESADYKEKEALAQQILQKISRGADFEKLLAEYGEDPGMKSNGDGYLIDFYGFTPDGSQMIPEFTNASLMLEVGKVSDVVPSAYGFHIIKRYPIDNAFINSYISKNLEDFAANALTNTLMEYTTRVVVENRAELEAIDVSSVFKK